MITAPGTLGFSDEAALKDRCQLQFLSQLMRQGADRFVLKGGLAMRALFASARLTKDVDFDCEDSVSVQSMKNQLPRALEQAARLSGLTRPAVHQTKDGDRACRWRLDVTLPATGRQVSYDVEISRCGLPPPAYISTQTVRAPLEYRMTPFVVRAYTATAMAAGKVNALLSVNRSVPRDVYDLYDLQQHGADPTPLWVESVPREVLARKRALVLEHVLGIGHDLVVSELQTYLPPAERAALDEARWDEMRTAVAEAVDRWFAAAIPRARTSEALGHDAEDNADLAGR